jgi:hypothetical protein
MSLLPASGEFLLDFPFPRHLSSFGSYPLYLSSLGDPTGSNATASLALRVPATHKPLYHRKVEIPTKRRLFMYNKNKRGPKIDPCGIPYFIILCEDEYIFCLEILFSLVVISTNLTDGTDRILIMPLLSLLFRSNRVLPKVCRDQYHTPL